MRSALQTISFNLIILFLITSFGWTTEVICHYNQVLCDVTALKKLLKAAEYVEKTEIEELVRFAFTIGYHCNDEDRAMCIQKTVALDVNITKRLTVVVYYFSLGHLNYIYKIEFVDEKRIFIGHDIEVGHNLVSQKDWANYMNTEKFLIKQRIIRDGDTSLNTGQSIPLDGQPDFIFEDTYIKTKDHTVIHSENKTVKIDENAPKIFNTYSKEMLEYVRNGFD